MSTMCWNGFRKMLRGCRELRVDQNGAANAMECLPDLKTAIEKSKNPKNLENQGNPGFSWFLRFLTFFEFFSLFWGLGGIPLHSERNSDQYECPQTPNRPFSTHFSSFLDMFGISDFLSCNSFGKSRPQRALSRQSPMWKMVAYSSSS